jgi:hypothetical protein
MAKLKTIRIELARTKDHPSGDPGHGYEFRAPLDATGHLDATVWPDCKQLCTVRRFEKGATRETGLLVRTQGGKWVFSYAPGDEDDEAIFKFSTHAFKPGEYVSVTEHDGELRTFRIASVVDWHPPR